MRREDFVIAIKDALQPVIGAGGLVQSLSSEERKTLERDLVEWQPGSNEVDSRARKVSFDVLHMADHSDA